MTAYVEPGEPLTPREAQVMTLVAQGLTARAVARRLGTAKRTVDKHLQNAYAKLGATNRVDAVLRAWEQAS